MLTLFDTSNNSTSYFNRKFACVKVTKNLTNWFHRMEQLVQKEKGKIKFVTLVPLRSVITMFV